MWLLQETVMIHVCLSFHNNISYPFIKDSIWEDDIFQWKLLRHMQILQSAQMQEMVLIELWVYYFTMIEGVGVIVCLCSGG